MCYTVIDNSMKGLPIWQTIKLPEEEILIEITDSMLHLNDSEALDVRRVLETAVKCV